MSWYGTNSETRFSENSTTTPSKLRVASTPQEHVKLYQTPNDPTLVGDKVDDRTVGGVGE